MIKQNSKESFNVLFLFLQVFLQQEAFKYTHNLRYPFLDRSQAQRAITWVFGLRELFAKSYRFQNDACVCNYKITRAKC